MTLGLKKENNVSYRPQWYASPIDLPEGQSGSVSVKHRILQPGEKTPIVGYRQAILRGQTPSMAIIQEPLRVHYLSHEDHGTWMTDLPEELNQIAEMLYTVDPMGHVLVGGLGLGLVAKLLTQRRWVESVTVIEKDPDVIRLCVQPGYTTIEADIYDYLKETDQRFDCYLLDTWQGTNESTWWTQVMPLRRIIRNRWGKVPLVHCWAEDIMLGQILGTMTRSQPHWVYEHLPIPMPPSTARAFTRNVGLPTWERKYGKKVPTKGI